MVMARVQYCGVNNDVFFPRFCAPRPERPRDPVNPAGTGGAGPIPSCRRFAETAPGAGGVASASAQAAGIQSCFKFLSLGRQRLGPRAATEH